MKEPRIFLLDSYDSFTFNIAHYLEKAGCSVDVYLNNQCTVAQAAAYDAIVLSPGPGLPKDAGILLEVIDHYLGKKPILGVCLGLQALCEHVGASLYNRTTVMHGRQVPLEVHAESCLLQGVGALDVGLYHSWAIDGSNLPQQWAVKASALDGVPMVVEAPELKAMGTQFHPESVLTPEGQRMIDNWVASLD